MSRFTWMFALAAATALTAGLPASGCGFAGDMGAGDEGGGGPGSTGTGELGGGTQDGSDGASLQSIPDGGSQASGSGDPPSGCPAGGAYSVYDASPAPWGSMASAQYAAALAAEGVVVDPGVVELGDFLAYFGPERGTTAYAVGALTRTSLDADTLDGELDVTVVPPAAFAERPPVHVVAVVDAGQSMYLELPLAAEALRSIGGALDVDGDRLSVLRWSAAPARLAEGAASPLEAAEQAASALLASGEQLPPSADLLTMIEAIESLDTSREAHVVVLTDGGSPVDPSAVTRLALGDRRLSAAQLVPAGRSVAEVGFAGGVVRGVARVGQGAAWWLREDPSDPTLLGRDFDAIFRTRVRTRLRLELPQPLDAYAPGELDAAPPVRGVGAPARVVLQASVCSTELFDALGAAAAHWGSFTLDAGPAVSVGVEPARQAQWLAARGAFELARDGCPAEVPEALMSLLAELPRDPGPNAVALDAFVRDFLGACGLAP